MPTGNGIPNNLLKTIKVKMTMIAEIRIFLCHFLASVIESIMNINVKVVMRNPKMFRRNV
jgi:hypothetical protein